MIGIDKGVPLPPKKVREEKYPWSVLEVGDSFFVPKPLSSLSGAQTAAAKRLGRRFSSRSETGGTRIWRIE